ncbi:8888_t:CDS:2 [Gigaspora margarita]|uniref:8888_t:CDS:1 n=1 Tax=Gigaspora margarita TaxID=4874 RepID=A0ABN7UCI3_GIGMA|nr:8888_t:CDS:2 [Gigaspora margarita]
MVGKIGPIEDFVTPSILWRFDIYREIICHLQGDVSSLYSCVFVNRLWCDNATRMLWRHPFRVTKDLPKEKRAALIETYLCCLSNEDKACLAASEVYVPLPTRQPAFNYPEYLRHLSIESLYTCVSMWVQCTMKRNRNKVTIQISCLLRNLFMSQSPILDALSLDMNPDIWKDHLSFLQNGADTWLSRLRELRLFAPLPNWSIFTYLTRNTTRLRKLDIYLINYPSIPADAHSIAMFIQVQQSLEHFILVNNAHLIPNSSIAQPFHNLLLGMSGAQPSSTSTESRCLPIFLSALASRQDTLSHAEFSGISFEGNASLNALSICFQNLESLEINSCVFPINARSWVPTDLPGLRKLSFSPSSDCNYDVFLRLIRGAKEKLREVYIGNVVSPSPIYKSVIDTIILHCPNITTFAAPWSTDDMSQLLNLLHRCVKLQSLTLFNAEQWNTGSDNNDTDKNDVSSFLPKLGISLPNTLRHLDIELPWWFTAGALESFLKNSKAPLETLKFRNSPWISDDHKYLVKIAFYLNDTLKDKNVVQGAYLKNNYF